ncbi:Ornithine decarboxylase antizyme [Geosmithia morbida]|uniref:Ornithine decarboxylase antizyme n=1 Tax=Geosmithia morbida TaxID=1094350 RepID=A0A9P5D3S2_9HYPO|nr:Ornithine decarboxylase antizyme [Geosmithia morbida]KAF4122806.1 Ornithine decarboxylase antizyme [Geosmithia morbida]
MALVSNQSSNLNSNYGQDAVQKVNVLSSCYIVDSQAQLKGLHYCTTGAAGLPSPPTSPPLAALNSSNELALLPKQKKRDNIPGRRLGRRGGAALSIREECERFFCESMKTAFLGERNPSKYGSGLNSAQYQAQSMLPTPPPDNQFPPTMRRGSDAQSLSQQSINSSSCPGPFNVATWMEVWDYAGGASFRAFTVDNGEETSLFVFFDIEGIVGRDLKKALMALIELADGPLGCSHIVVCIDRRIPAQDAVELTKSLQWVGFEMMTLDHWANDLDVTSKRWVFMGMDM